jgi:hypothetical protein
MYRKCDGCGKSIIMDRPSVLGWYHRDFLFNVCDSDCAIKALSGGQHNLFNTVDLMLGDIIKVYNATDKYWRSEWERSFSDWLRRNGIKHYYEPVIFKGNNKTGYIPDFVIRGKPVVVELKGRATAADIDKAVRMSAHLRKLNIKYYMLGEKELRKIGGII